MLIIVGSMQGTMVSLASMASLGSVANERSHSSLVRRSCLSKGNWVKKKRWHCVSLSVCKYSVTTTTDLVPEQSNTYRGGKGEDSDSGFLRKPTPKPVLMSSRSTWEPSIINGDSDDDGEKLGDVKERNKVIESLGEVLEKAEKLETSRVSESGSRRETRVVNKSTPSNTSSNSTTTATQNSKTLKSVWRKGDNVGTVQKVVKQSSKNGSKIIEKEEIKTEGQGKVESQSPTSPRSPQPPLRPQPKLQAKPFVAPKPVIKKPVILKDVGAVEKSSVIDETDSDLKTKERKPILIDKFASKKSVVDPLIAQAVLAPAKPGKGPPPGRFKDDYRKKSATGGGSRRRMANNADIQDEDTSELNVSIPGAAKGRKGRKWTKASRKAAKLQAAREAAPVKVEILEVGKEGMLIEELAYNLTIGEGEILGYLYAKGIKPDGVQKLDKDIVKMICKEHDVEVLDADPIKVEEMARKKEIFDEEDLDKLQDRPPVITIMGHVDHGKVSVSNSGSCFLFGPSTSISY
jgi:translation initiation factor IF-2